MIDLSNQTALVIDHGTFVEFALRLARKPGGFGRVLYHVPYEYGYSHVADAMVGNGFESDGVEWCDDPFDPAVLTGVDVVCFPDVQHAGLQLLLESFGLPVWGSRRGDSIELLRGKFRRMLKEMGLPVQTYDNITGFTNLIQYLQDNPGVFVKISRFRGSMETKEHIDMQLSQNWLDNMAVELGAVREMFPFIVEHRIDKAKEIGLDSFNVDGQFPNTCMEGVEVKDKMYVGEVKQFSDVSEPLRHVAELLAPLLREFHYRNWMSTELRITEDGTPFFIDPCQRLASPGGESMLEIYHNVPQFVHAGAKGELLEPEPEKKYSVQCWIEHRDSPKLYRAVRVPDEIRRFVKLRYACKIKGVYQIVPQPEGVFSPPDPHIGFAIGLGDTLDEAKSEVKRVAEAMEGQNVTVHTELLDESMEMP